MIKGLIIAFALITSELNGAIAPNTLALWTLASTPNDSSGNGRNLTNTGPVAYVISPPPPVGTIWAGPYAIGSYFSSTDSAFSSLSAYTFEGYCRTGELSGLNFITSIYNAPTASVAFRVTTTGVLRCIVNNTTVIDSAAIVSANTDYYWAITFDGTTIKTYISPANAISNTAVASQVVAAALPASATVFLGRHGEGGAEGPWTGYLGRVVVSNVARTTFPTNPIENTARAMDLDYQLELDLSR